VSPIPKCYWGGDTTNIVRPSMGCDLPNWMQHRGSVSNNVTINQEWREPDDRGQRRTWHASSRRHRKCSHLVTKKIQKSSMSVSFDLHIRQRKGKVRRTVVSIPEERAFGTGSDKSLGYIVPTCRCKVWHWVSVHSMTNQFPTQIWARSRQY